MKFWTLLSGTSYVASISNPSFTSNPMLAVKYANIKMADVAANEWKRKYGLSVMVHVVSDLDTAPAEGGEIRVGDKVGLRFESEYHKDRLDDFIVEEIDSSGKYHVKGVKGEMRYVVPIERIIQYRKSNSGYYS